MRCEILKRKNAPGLAYVKTDGMGPTVMFLGGFASDMEGTKATYLEKQCQVRGQGFIRFDYSGHGQSEGVFKDGTIGGWLQDSLDIIDQITAGPLVLAGSSMGGWIGMLAALQRPQRVKGFIGIAAAPDFTKDMVDSYLTEAQKQEMKDSGYTYLPNDYGDPYIITQKLVDEAQTRMLLDKKIDLDIPIRLIQGMKDGEVEWKSAHRIKDVISGSNVEIFLVEDGDHRLSRDKDLALIDSQIARMNA